MGPLVAVDLSCGYRGRAVFRGVSLDARAGEVLAVLGPNGAGKTTLLRAMAGLARPTAGAVLLEGRDLAGYRAGEVARLVAFATQGMAPDWPFTVREFVSLGRAPHRGWWRPLAADDRAAVDEALARLMLEDLGERPVNELSGGEWQRVRLAKGLAQAPRILLLDEPTAHLDPRFQYELLSAARSLARERGLAVVLSMHDLNLAGTWADRLALLAGGRLLADGPPEAVLTPDLLAEAYGIRLSVAPHPSTGAPAVSHAAEAP